MLEAPFSFKLPEEAVREECTDGVVLALDMGACREGCSGGGGRVAADMWEKRRGLRIRRTGERSRSGAISSELEKKI